jgi:hypothetical protein
MVRARAAVLRQEIFEGSRALIGSATLSIRADIVFFFSVFSSGPAFPWGRKRVVNDSKLAMRDS